MLDRLLEPVPLWLFLLMIALLALNLRTRGAVAKAKHTDFLNGDQAILVRFPNQYKLDLSKFSAALPEALKSYNQRLAVAESFEQAWEAADRNERRAATLERLRYIQQFLNIIMAPDWIFELTEEKWGLIGTIDEPYEAVCLNVFKGSEKVAVVEASPAFFKRAYATDVRVRLYRPEMYDADEVFHFFRSVAAIHFTDDQKHNISLENQIYRQMNAHLWNFHHGASIARSDNSLNIYENDCMDLTFTGSCHYLQQWSTEWKIQEDIFEKEQSVIEHRAECDGLSMTH